MPDATVLPYWGVLQDVESPAHYAGLTWRVTWHLLDVAERQTLNVRVERLPESLRHIGAMKIRIAMALVAINGRRVTFRGEDADDEFVRRIEWLDRHPEMFLDAVYESYLQAERQPAIQYAAASADPNTAAPLDAPSGASSATVATLPADGSLPPTGLSSPSTASSTRKRAQRSGTRTS